VSERGTLLKGRGGVAFPRSRRKKRRTVAKIRGSYSRKQGGPGRGGRQGLTVVVREKVRLGGNSCKGWEDPVLQPKRTESREEGGVYLSLKSSAARVLPKTDSRHCLGKGNALLQSRVEDLGRVCCRGQREEKDDG